MVDKFVKVGDSEIHYLEKGSGKVVILLPSLWLTSFSYKGLGKVLSNRFLVIIPDLYRGFSKHPKIASSFEDYADLLEEFIRKLQVNNIFLVGFSFSGAVAATYAIKYPDRLSKLLLVSTSLVPLDSTRRFLNFILNYLELFLNNSLSLRGIIVNFLWLYDGIKNLFLHPRQFLEDAFIVNRHYKVVDQKFIKPVLLLFANRDEFLSQDLLKKMKHIYSLQTEVVPGRHTWFFVNEALLVKKVIDFFGKDV